jgi:hypothetical protein
MDKINIQNSILLYENMQVFELTKNKLLHDLTQNNSGYRNLSQPYSVIKQPEILL